MTRSIFEGDRARRRSSIRFPEEEEEEEEEEGADQEVEAEEARYLNLHREVNLLPVEAPVGAAGHLR